MTYTIQTKFKLRDQVFIDGCKELIGIITAIQWRDECLINYEVSWVTNGKSEAAMIEGWRLVEKL